jgi:hypothetical protein
MKWAPTRDYNKKLSITETDLLCLSKIGYIDGPYQQEQYGIKYWKLTPQFVVYQWINNDDSVEYFFEWGTERREQQGLESYDKLLGSISSNCSAAVNELTALTERVKLGDDTDWNISAYYPDQRQQSEGILLDVMNKISEMKYASNTFKDKRHEQNVEDILKDAGFKKVERIEDVGSDGFYYIPQPNGSQSPPDFRVVANGESVDIECKSCKNGYKPMWNASYPKDDTVYVFTNRKDNNTMVFFGNKIVTPQVKAIYDDYIEQNKQLEKVFNQRLNALSVEQNPYRMRVYARNMFVQTRHLNRDQQQQYKEDVINKLKSTV